MTGTETGDLAHPLPYCPEFYQKEFTSAVADMKNSVANRDNAQSSCAGQFIGKRTKEAVIELGLLSWSSVSLSYIHPYIHPYMRTASHLGDYINTGRWMHIDMAYPVHNGERATGYGVNLLCGILDKLYLGERASGEKKG